MEALERSELISAISKAGDRYGYGENGLIALMEESGANSTMDVTDAQIETFAERHGIETKGRTRPACEPHRYCYASQEG